MSDAIRILDQHHITKDNIQSTVSILVDLRDANYHVITIGYDPESVACKWWYNGPRSLWGWHPEGKITNVCRDNMCRPSIWRIAKKHDVCGGAGNSHQYQIKKDHNLIEGTYDLTKLPADIETAIVSAVFEERI